MSFNSWEDRKRPAVSDGDSVDSKKAKGNVKYNVTPLVKRGAKLFSMSVRYNDEVHRSVDFCPLLHAMMDTWPVQRLRDIKQLGTTYLVYATGNHTRFEHSVGVAFLAREMCRRLQSKFCTLRVTDKDVLCVTLAGLLHDLGHGPFSHLYEDFREEINRELESDAAKRKLYERFPSVPTKWKHELSSLMMVDAALKSLGLEIDMRPENLDKPLMQIGDGIDANTIRCYWSDNDEENEVLTNRDWIFIKECIYGKALPGLQSRIGRLDPKHEWLYDIVSNAHNGIDVDKVDYFARDERRTMGEAGNIDISVINESCVAKAKCSNKECTYCRNGRNLHYQICYPMKCVSRVIEFFKTRGRLHEHVYQHKTNTAAACMVVDILKLADRHYLIPTEDPNVQLPISRAFYNQHSFERLRDSIIDGILSTTSAELQPARELATRFVRRQLYKLGGEKVLHTGNRKHQELWTMAKENPEKIVSDICALKPRHDNLILTEDDVIVKGLSWHQGQMDKNPLSFVRFVDKNLPSYIKTNDDCPKAVPVKDMKDYHMSTTVEFQKRVIRVYSRDPAKKDLLAHAFEAYWTHYMDRLFSGTPLPNEGRSGLQFESGTGSGEESNDDSNDGFMARAGDPVELTQESGDEMDFLSPSKSPGGSNLAFASPELRFRRL